MVRPGLQLDNNRELVLLGLLLLYEMRVVRVSGSHEVLCGVEYESGTNLRDLGDRLEAANTPCRR